MPDSNSAKVAYFSMEIGLEPLIPTYSGGLGALAGDSLRSAADLGVPMVGVTLVHRKGYFRQQLDARGNQLEEAARNRLKIAERRLTSRLKGGRSKCELGNIRFAEYRDTKCQSTCSTRT